jgi:hypothetical protein
MKKASLIFLFVFSALFNYAQDFKYLPGINMEKLEDYEEYESTALKCANYLLDNEVDAEEQNRALAVEFMMRWMTGTDIKFELGDDFVKYGDKDTDRMAVYLAALVKVALEDPEQDLKPAEINELGAEVFLDYCAENKSIKKNKAIKKELKNRKA